EVAALAYVDSLRQPGFSDANFQHLFVHSIRDDALASYGATSKLNNQIDFLRHLHAVGVRAAERWLADNHDAIGKRSTVDLSGLIPTRHASLVAPHIVLKQHEAQA